MNEPVVTIVGNLAGDPELRFTPSGAAVATFTVASTPRRKVGDQWQDGTTLWMRCNVWREQAENVVESLRKGQRVVVIGRMTQREWDDKEGNKRVSIEVEADDVAASCKFATVTANRVQRASQGGGGFGGGGGQRYAPPQDDPWATPRPARQPAGAGAGYGPSDEPPFAHTTGLDLAVERGEVII